MDVLRRIIFRYLSCVDLDRWISLEYKKSFNSSRLKWFHYRFGHPFLNLKAVWNDWAAAATFLSCTLQALSPPKTVWHILYKKLLSTWAWPWNKPKNRMFLPHCLFFMSLTYRHSWEGQESCWLSLLYLGRLGGLCRSMSKLGGRWTMHCCFAHLWQFLTCCTLR